MNEELNKKLAERAGIKWKITERTYNHLERDIWVYPDGTIGDEPPNFTQSLDACFKWLVPKVEPMGYDLDISNDLEMLGWSVCLHNTKSECSIASPMEHCELGSIALALCLAIEKLIDKEVK